MAEALARETPAHHTAVSGLAALATHTALRAAQAAYERRFGHVFVLCTDGISPEEVLGHGVDVVRVRLANKPERERVVTAEELRCLARGRLGRLVTGGLPAPRRPRPSVPD